jgi:predicted transcriptional regulator
MLGRYSHLCEQGERLKALLEMVPQGSTETFPRTPKRVMHRLKVAEVEALVAGYASGVGITELVEQFQVDQSTVQKYVRPAGLPRRSQRVPPTKVDEVVLLYGAGHSVESIAEKLEVAPTTVRRALTRAEVALRRRGRPSTTS